MLSCLPDTSVSSRLRLRPWYTEYTYIYMILYMYPTFTHTSTGFLTRIIVVYICYRVFTLDYGTPLFGLMPLLSQNRMPSKHQQPITTGGRRLSLVGSTWNKRRHILLDRRSDRTNGWILLSQILIPNFPNSLLCAPANPPLMREKRPRTIIPPWRWRKRRRCKRYEESC